MENLRFSLVSSSLLGFVSSYLNPQARNETESTYNLWFNVLVCIYPHKCIFLIVQIMTPWTNTGAQGKV